MPLLTQTVSGYELVVTFAGYDTNGRYGERQQTFEIVGADFATAKANADAFLADLGAVTEASIIGHRLAEVYGTADLIPATQITLRKVTVVTFRSGTDFTEKLPHNLMCPADAILADGSALITTNAAVIAWYANFQAAGGVRISDGEFISDDTPIVKSRSKVQASGITY